MLTGLSAFPLTPFTPDGSPDEAGFVRLVERLAAAGVDSIGALGSTGSYAYLRADERARLTRLAVEAAAGVPVMVGVGAVATRDVLAHVDAAQEAGAAAVLLAPVSYQPLTLDEVLGLYADVSAASSIPVTVYDNPATTRFAFTDELTAAIARLPHVTAVKIPGVPADEEAATARVARLRALLPAHVTVGVSGDASAATGLLAGCDAWFSVVAGVLPGPALALTRAARAGDHEAVRAEEERLQPLLALFARHGGSLRVVAALAEHLGLVGPDCLPRPIRGLDLAARAEVADVADRFRPHG
ncbi:dihydrodipicolinate synthase family protein [Amnibacterium endophyticum]|uniref:Dihydrodipicolinate synthase family protein n=1 Tax=Amnibacterium endophyticum TaxID=2109337 RepID=A0ABW4L9P9_9MICO